MQELKDLTDLLNYLPKDLSPKDQEAIKKAKNTLRTLIGALSALEQHTDVVWRVIEPNENDTQDECLISIKERHLQLEEYTDIRDAFYMIERDRKQNAD